MDRAINGHFPENGLVSTLGAWSDGSGPLYQRLAASLQLAIERGDLTAGTRLPAERVLADQLRVSRTTVVAAYERLRDARLVSRRQGSGTRVESRTFARHSGLELAREVGRNSLFRGLIDRPEGALDMVGAYLLAPDGLPPSVLDGVDRELADLGHTSGYWPLGYPPLRAAIARYLSGRGLPTSLEQVLVTAGAQQAIHLVAWVYLERGASVVVENPTYPGALDSFTSLGARLLGVATGRNGVDVDQLTEVVIRAGPRLAYVIPTYQNPVGGVLPSIGRRALAQLAEEHGIAVIEDDSLAGLGLTDSEPPPMAAFVPTPSTPVLTVGSLSKVCWGGLRVGWVRAPESLAAQLGRIKAVTDLGCSLPAQVIATRVFGAFETIRRERVRVVAERFEYLSRLLREQLPTWRWDPPRGGLCLWVRLPRGSAAGFAQIALRHGVSLVPGSVASPDGSYTDYLRVPFGQEPAVLEQAVHRLVSAWEAYAPQEPVRPESLSVVV
jgi:DNA-binding transcriptional MocR family regulator